MWTNWSIRMYGTDFSVSNADYLRWARGQACLDLANGWAQGKPKIREAARAVRDAIDAELATR